VFLCRYDKGTPCPHSVLVLLCTRNLLLRLVCSVVGLALGSERSSYAVPLRLPFALSSSLGMPGAKMALKILRGQETRLSAVTAVVSLRVFSSEMKCSYFEV
jgi:hypothetical protein